MQDVHIRFTGISMLGLMVIVENMCMKSTYRFEGYPHKIYKDLYVKLVKNCTQNLLEITCS